MTDQADEQADQSTDAETAVDAESEEAAETEAVLDIEAIDERERTVEELEDRVAELEDLVLDLSTRVADDGGLGVCPECHGPVTKVRRWVRSNSIECQRCGEVFHEY
ncbi:MAG: hypothetical protein ABEJ08_00960 [Halobacteriaceae archaeon]